MSFSRRRFLQGMVLAGAATLLPTFAEPKATRQKTLIMIHLNGGNDGLNTVIPYTDPLYHHLRPTLAQSKKLVLPLNKELALHPAMGGMRELYEAGELGIVLGTGYEQPNLSHFRSTEIWYSAATQTQESGWLNKAIDCSKTCDTLSGVAVGHSPFALSGPGGPAPNLTDPSRFELSSGLKAFEAKYKGWADRGGLEGQVGRLGASAFEVSRTVAKIRPAKTPKGPGLAKDLRLVLSLLEADLGIKYLHLALPGFDTHDGQGPAHSRLLGGLSESITSFQRELDRRGLADEVVTVLFSEFGRRPKENSGGGTDHGTAGPLFVVGKSVQAGLHGSQPSLENLQAGNLRHTVDFRRVYASLLNDWCGIAPSQIVQGYTPLDIIKKA